MESHTGAALWLPGVPSINHKHHKKAPPLPNSLLAPHAHLTPAARPFRPLFCWPRPVSICKPPIMVRTRGGHRYRPRVQTRSPARDATGTSRASADIYPVQGAEAPPSVSPATAIASSNIPEEPQGVEPPSR